MFSKNQTYDEFVKQQAEKPHEVALKAKGKNLTDTLLDDIVLPSFYSDVATFDTLVLYQGAVFNDKPHYDQQEQILCAIDSYLQVIMIPGVYRQEVETGKKLWQSVFYEDKESSKNTSPINFFSPDKTKYQHYRYDMKKFVYMDPGDCLFVPAYYFYQMQGTKKPHQ